jgi:phospholipid/cholesterol/gamma-HCH transport system permease protein
MVSITALATGMVLVVQMGSQFVKMGAESYVGGVVALAQARELSPILTAIVVAGRVGSAMAAEIGTMKVTEQIDALQTLAVSPIRFLVVPRLIAGFIMLPLLTIYANFIGIAGGLFVAVAQLNMSVVSFKESVIDQLMIHDIMGGLLKALVFGLIISMVGCYRGFITRGGAEGVGASTTGAVVTAIMIIFVCNYFLSVLIVNFVEAFLY